MVCEITSKLIKFSPAMSETPDHLIIITSQIIVWTRIVPGAPPPPPRRAGSPPKGQPDAGRVANKRCMRKKMPGYGTTGATSQTAEFDGSQVFPVARATVPKNFFAIVYSAAFLLSLGGGFLSGKTSYIIVSLFAGRDCVGVQSDQCNDALNKYTGASAVTTFTSLGFALFTVPFLTRASDAFGRRVFIQVRLRLSTKVY